MMKDEIKKRREEESKQRKIEVKRERKKSEDELVEIIERNKRIYKRLIQESPRLDKLKKDIIEVLSKRDCFHLNFRDDRWSILLENDSYFKFWEDDDHKVEISYIKNLSRSDNKDFVKKEKELILKDVKDRVDVKGLTIEPKFIQGCDYIKFLLNTSFVVDYLKVSYKYEYMAAPFHTSTKSYAYWVTFDKDFIVDFLEKEGLNVTELNDYEINVTL